MEILHLCKHITTFNLFLHTIVVLFLCKYNALCDENIGVSHRGSLSSSSPPDLSFIGQNISLIPEQLFRLLLDAEYVEARNRALGLNAPPINLFDAINQFTEVSGNNGDSQSFAQPVFQPPIQTPRHKLSPQKSANKQPLLSAKKKIAGKSSAMVADLIGKNLSPIKRNDQRANSVEHLLRQLISHHLLKPTLSERGSVTDWLQKLSAYMFKQLRNLIIPARDNAPTAAATASHQQNSQPLPHPPSPLPFHHPVFPASHLSPFNALYPPQEAESVYHSFANNHFINAPQTEQYFEDNDVADAEHINLASDNHLNSDFLSHRPPHHQPYNPEEYKVVDDEQNVEDTRQTYADIPVYTEEDENRHYQYQANAGSNRQHINRPSYQSYQSYQHQSNQQPIKNSKDSAQTTSSSDVRFEYINTHNYHGKNDNYRYARNNNHYHNNHDNSNSNNNNNNNNNNANMGHNSNSELVIPLYTDVRINQPSNDRTHRQHHYQHQPQHIVRSASQLRPIVHNVPQQAIQYIIHDNQIETEECREGEPFKPLVTATTTGSDEAQQSAQKRLSRKKRYIDFDYSKLQLRRVPIWFPRRNGVDITSAASSDAIVEIKPRSLFRWRQPMQGWKPIIPPEDERKNIFLKRSGTDDSSESEQTSDSWDHHQVESHAYFQWQKMSPEFVETQSKNTKPLVAMDDDVVEASAEESRSSPNIELLHNKQQHSSDNNNEQKRVQRRIFFTEYSKYNNKPQLSDDFAENKYAAETLAVDDPQQQQRQQNAVIKVEISNPLSQTQKNDTTTSNASNDTETMPNGNHKQYVVEDVKAVEMKHLPDITKAKSLREISEIPGAVIRPIDPKLTDILLKILNQNQDFSSKRITNAYFLEFPKVAEYRPKHTPKSVFSQHNEQSLGENSESAVDSHASDIKLEIDSDDVPMTETDFEYGQQVCSDKYSGSFADKRKDCRLYYVCTETTVDTYVCPKGTRFDAINQSCRQYNDVVC